MTSTKEQLTRRFAAVAIALVGVIHLVLAPEQIKAEAYVGVLFIVGGLAALVVAARLWMTSDRFAWTLGVLVSVGMFVSFILSRTTGLPGFKESEWELSGIFCLILEAGFVGAFLSARRARPLATTRSAAPRQAGPRRRGAPEAARQVW